MQYLAGERHQYRLRAAAPVLARPTKLEFEMTQMAPLRGGHQPIAGAGRAQRGHARSAVVTMEGTRCPVEVQALTAKRQRPTAPHRQRVDMNRLLMLIVVLSKRVGLP
jgi:DNA repair protein RadA/Sms